MNYFPQMATGAVAQYPVGRSRRWRWISNVLESGETIQLPDAAASQIGWKLKYADLSAAEASNIAALFNACQGQYGAFLFIDPMANLLGWSEDFMRPNWQAGQITITAGVADPIGSARGAMLANSAPAEQTLTQTINLPGDYAACFSVWARSDSAAQFALQRDTARANLSLSKSWARYQISAAGAAGATQSAFSIAVPAGESIQIFGPQVEPQPSAASYKPTTAPAGIYPETYFAADDLVTTSTGPGLYGFDITLISRVQF